VGLLLGAVEYIFGITVIEGLAPIEEGALICFRISLTLCGVFPLVHLLSRLLGRPLRALGKRVGINEVSVLGLLHAIWQNTKSVYHMLAVWIGSFSSIADMV
jgi:ethanolamine transporter